MNLEHPVARWLGQKEANDYLGQFPRQTDEERLAAALFRGFATLGGLAAEAPPTTGVPTE
jgi:hypothetical protein